MAHDCDRDLHYAIGPLKSSFARLAWGIRGHDGVVL
jgi:hypothetical protein